MIPFPRGFPGIALAAASLAAVSPATVSFAQSIEVPLTYHTPLTWGEDYFPWGGTMIQPVAQRPEGAWTWPEHDDEHPLYAVLTIGDSVLPLLFVRKDEESVGHDRLYCDLDGDSDLTDDPPIDGFVYEFDLDEDGSTDDRLFYVNFIDGTSLSYSIGEQVLPFRLIFNLQIWNPDSADRSPSRESLREDWGETYLEVATECVYTGEFTVAEQRYRVLLHDLDANGSFADPARFDSGPGVEILPTLPIACDALYLTAADEFTWTDVFSLGDRLLIEERLYEVRVELAERKLVLTPNAEELVPLTLAGSPRRLTLLGGEGSPTIMIDRPPATVRIPAGRYRVLGYELNAKGEHDDEWLLYANGTDGTPFVEVRDPAGSRLEFGAPFIAKAEIPAPAVLRIRDGTAEDDEVPLHFVIDGAAGERVVMLQRTRGTRSAIEMSTSSKYLPREPRYTVVSSSGEKVASGAFEYG